jgi:hypothetical protein
MLASTLRPYITPVPEAAAAYECALTLVQPDGFVAWRGESLPSKAGAILDRVRGVSP